MKTLRIEFGGNYSEDLMCRYGASHDCDGCSYYYEWSERRDDWGDEDFGECKYKPNEAEYISNDPACDRDTVIHVNEDEESEIIKYLINEPELLFDYLDGLSIISEAMKSNNNVYDFIVDHYEKKIQEDK